MADLRNMEDLPFIGELTSKYTMSVKKTVLIIGVSTGVVLLLLVIGFLTLHILCVFPLEMLGTRGECSNLIVNNSSALAGQDLGQDTYKADTVQNTPAHYQVTRIHTTITNTPRTRLVTRKRSPAAHLVLQLKKLESRLLFWTANADNAYIFPDLKEAKTYDGRYGAVIITSPGTYEINVQIQLRYLSTDKPMIRSPKVKLIKIPEVLPIDGPEETVLQESVDRTFPIRDIRYKEHFYPVRLRGHFQLNSGDLIYVYLNNVDLVKKSITQSYFNILKWD